MTITNSSPLADVNSLLMGGGGARSAFTKDTPVGTVVGGTIVSAESRQQTDYVTGEAKTWDDGNPMMQVVVVVQTDLDEDSEDDGKRAFYLKGSTKNDTTTAGAVAKAIRDAGAPGLEIGATLEMALTGFEAAQKRGMSDRKLWAARYTRPVVPVGDANPFANVANTATSAPEPLAPPAPAPANNPFADADPGF